MFIAVIIAYYFYFISILFDLLFKISQIFFVVMGAKLDLKINRSNFCDLKYKNDKDISIIYLTHSLRSI